MDAIELSDLAVALRVEQGELISLVGGGGKTTTLFALGLQLRGPTVLTTTTKMGAEQSDDCPVLIDPTDDELRQSLDVHARVLVWKDADGRRAIGVTPSTCDRWLDIASNVVVEADGSRKRPFKAPAAHEPVVPSRTSLLVACIGAGAFGRSIVAGCHRPEIVAELAECETDDVLTPVRAARVLTSPAGSRKGLPSAARFVVVLHRISAEHAALAHDLEAALADQAELIAVADTNR